MEPGIYGEIPIVVNGGFETGNLAGWTLPLTIDTGSPHTGTYCVKMRGSVLSCYIEQEFSPTIYFSIISSFFFYIKGTPGQQIFIYLRFSPYATASYIYTLTTSNYEFVDILSLFPGETRYLQYFRIQTWGMTQFEYVLIDDVSLTSEGTEKITNGGFETGDFTGWTPYPSTSNFTIRTSSPTPYNGIYYLRTTNTRSGYVWQPVSIPLNTISSLSVWFFATGASADPCSNYPTSIGVGLNLSIYGSLTYTRTAQIGEDNWEKVDIKALMVAAGVTDSDTINEIYLGNGSDSPPYYVDIDFLTLVASPLLLGTFFTRVLETRTAKYSAHQFPSINQEYLQSLGLKNRLFLIEALGTGSASSPTDRTAARNSVISIPGQEGFILTRLMSDLLPVTFLNAEPVDTGGRPAELKIVIHAVERITGSA